MGIRQTMGRWTRGLAAAVALGMAGAAGAAPTFSSMVVFGDSLSDTGNVRNVLGSSNIISVPAGYGANGRFSNGKVWHEYLAPAIGVPVATASRVSGASNTNFAYGGARIDDGGLPSAGLLTQYAQYNARQPGGADADALYVLWGGGNDIRDLVGNPDPLAGIAASLGNLQGMLTGLIGRGASTFLIPNLPDLGKIPENRGSAREASASAATVAWNDALHAMLLGLSGQASIYYFDVYSTFNDLLDDPASYGFTDTTGTCRRVTLLIFESACAAAATTVFWDSIHPTTAAHRVLGLAAADLLLNGNPLALAAAEVPEPATLLLVLAALAVVLALRARRRRA